MLYNPVAYLERMHRKYPEHKIFSTTSIEIKPISSLTIKSDFTIDLRNKESDEFYPTMTEKGLRRDINYREQFFDRDNHWLSETIATYAQVFGRHHISAMAGFTADFKRLHSRKVYSRGYPDNDINSSIWDQANDWTSNTPKESKYEQTMVSFLARLLFVRRPLFPGGQRAPRRLFKAACEQELRLVPLGIGIVETLVRKILPECRPRQGFRPGQVPRRLGPHR